MADPNNNGPQGDAQVGNVDPPSRAASPGGEEVLGEGHAEYGIACDVLIPESFTRDEAVAINARLARARRLNQTGVPADVALPVEEDDAASKKRKREEQILEVAALMAAMTPGTRKTFTSLVNPDSERDKRAKLDDSAEKKTLIQAGASTSKPKQRVTTINQSFPNEYFNTVRFSVPIPLTAFSNDVLKQVNKTGKVETITKHIYADNSSTVTKAIVLDPAQFDDEERLPQSMYLECYANFLRFLKEPNVASYETVDLIEGHHHIMATHPHAADLWPAIMVMDIWYRRYILTTGKSHPTQDYQDELASLDAAYKSVKVVRNANAINNVVAGASGTSASASIPPPPPPPPPSAPPTSGQGGRGRARGGRGRGQQPFQGGKDNKACLICGEDHHFRGCSAEKNKKGKATFCVRDIHGPSGIARRSNGTMVCSSWNLSADGGRYTRCPNNHPESHICSLCGSASHNANSGVCLGN
jgi:hypothetical protein